jgi:hypothetical protein
MEIVGEPALKRTPFGKQGSAAVIEFSNCSQ